MFHLQRLGAEHESAVLTFELENRAYFADTIGDRGDTFFADYGHEHRSLLVEQESGAVAFHVLVAEDGTVVGRFNLVDIADGSAVVGYRMAQSETGRGVATSALRELCGLARQHYGLRTLRAGTSTGNVASQRVLEKAGFSSDGEGEVGGRPGRWFRLELTGN